jgi:hypothetical protein
VRRERSEMEKQTLEEYRQMEEASQHQGACRQLRLERLVADETTKIVCGCASLQTCNNTHPHMYLWILC